jgi:heme/copper-type cytochrome/quinol oxidase subunit 2
VKEPRAFGRLLVLALVIAGGATGFLIASHPPEPKERNFTIRARQYAYEPAVIQVNRGDTVRLRLISNDVVHGFFLEGHDLDVRILPLEPVVELRRPSRPGEVEEVEEIVFTADREGKFRYRCSQTCGYMHPFMLGELVVAPNRLFPTSLGMTLGLLLGSLVVVARQKGEE